MKTMEQMNKKSRSKKPVEDTLKDREKQYRLIVDTADEGIWVFDENYITTFVNKRMADMLGYEPEEIEGKNLRDFVHEKEIHDFEREAIRRKKGLSGRYERMLRKKDGTFMWALVSATPILDANKVFIGSFAMFTDITERKNAEKALQLSEAKYRGIFENAVEGIFQSTPDGKLITVNPTMARIFGYSSQEEMLKNVKSIGRQLYACSEERHLFKKILEEKGIVEKFEAQFYKKDGTLLWGSLNVRAVKDEDGNVQYYEGTLEDITSRKKTEEELRKSEEKYRNIFENAAEGIFQVTPEGRYLSINPALARIHGFASPEEMMATVTDIAHQLYVDPRRRADLKRRMAEDGFVKDFEILMRKKDSSLQWVSVTSHAVRDNSGDILYYEGMLVDITSRKFSEEEVEKHKKTLNGIIETICKAIETRDPGTKGHQRRVCSLAKTIAEELGLTNEMIEIIGIASMIHDIGKLVIPAEILSKPEKVNEVEYSLIKTHPKAGYDMIKDAGLPEPVAEIVLQHHERLDGSGYPKGLKGVGILLEARILAVADVVEAMTSQRPHRSPFSIESAINEIEKGRGVLYDVGVTDICINLFKKRGFRF
ncbi:MAG: PAS domain S-box protein [Syntrophorhabdaceae bacterium]|nr:PAS domain S-box protein [Syntrophorhabdales bacterium]MBP9560209.1 PAS domain S-box protein [Syntrophorhabdaceae bacterium]